MTALLDAPVRVLHLTPADRAALRTVLHAVGKDRCRPMLTGVCFRGDRAIATDSYRMAEATLSHDGLDGLLLDAKALSKGIAGTKHAASTVTRSESGATVTTRTRVEVPAIVGTFPNTDQLWMTRETRDVTVKAVDLIDGCKRATAMRERQALPTITFTADGPTTITLSARSDHGTYSETIRASHPGEFEAITFNPRFLGELAKATGETHVTLRLFDALKPVQVVTFNARFLLMPVRT